ncbi:MAG: nuclease-related domain-containing protein [Anaerolineaceae bacterium]|nr:nuclease-related domain-containing protein [Anaerolineaceae bacterium]
MPIDPLLIKAGEYYKAGDKKAAAQLLYQYLQTHPEDPGAWYGSSKCFNNLETRKQCLEKTIELDPAFQKAKAELEEVKVRLNATALMTQSTDKFSVNYYEAEKPQPWQEHDPHTQQILTTRRMAEELGEKKHKFENAFWVLWVFVIILGVVGIFNPKNSPLLLGIIGFTILVRIFSPIFFDKYDATKKEHRAYEKGARGEETIVDLLSTLGPDFAVWHDVMTRYGNIDHIVLAKNGTLFMIETKANSGTVDASQGTLLLNGRRPPKDMIAQCVRNTYSLKETMEAAFGRTIWVQPILVFTNAFVHSGKPIKGVRVMNKKYLVETLRTHSTKAEQESWLWERKEELAKTFYDGHH